MVTFKNNTDDLLDIPSLGIHVEPGASFDVADEDADALRAQTNFVEVKAPKGAKADSTTVSAPAVADTTIADTSASTVGA